MLSEAEEDRLEKGKQMLPIIRDILESHRLELADWEKQERSILAVIAELEAKQEAKG